MCENAFWEFCSIHFLFRSNEHEDDKNSSFEPNSWREAPKSVFCFVFFWRAHFLTPAHLCKSSSEVQRQQTTLKSFSELFSFWSSTFRLNFVLRRIRYHCWCWYEWLEGAGVRNASQGRFMRWWIKFEYKVQWNFQGCTQQVGWSQKLRKRKYFKVITSVMHNPRLSTHKGTQVALLKCFIVK